jgi:hypothetical protein
MWIIESLLVLSGLAFFWAWCLDLVDHVGTAGYRGIDWARATLSLETSIYWLVPMLVVGLMTIY